MKASIIQAFLVLLYGSFALHFKVFATAELHQDNFHKHEHFDAHQQHDVRYDHEAFLGPDAEKFETFTPEQSKQRLRVIVEKKIDTDKDGVVSYDEMAVWLEKQQKAFMYDALEKRIVKEDKDKDEEISWQEYSNAHLGGWNETNMPKDHNLGRQIRKALYKFHVADVDKNGRLNSDEYVNFEHPETCKELEDIALDEVIDDIDRNRDGFITVDEFVGQYHDQENPPEWVIRHRQDFSTKFDKNKDGKMDRDEAREWILPQRHDLTDEVKHLMEGTDENADKFLSMDEILLHWNLFVGSKATDHGRTLKKVKREEL